MKKYLLLILVLFSPIFAQRTGGIEGKVTFISSQNVYVQFSSTLGILEKDTLFLASGGKEEPAILVSFISSQSVAGSKIGTAKILKDMVLKAYPHDVKKDEEIAVDTSDASNLVNKKDVKINKDNYKASAKKNYFGRFSVQSSSDISNVMGEPGYQRWRYSFNFEADKIGGSKFSTALYTTFSYLTSDWGREGDDIGRKLKVYDLKLKYDIDTMSFISGGRFINRKISNIGALDGLLYEKSFSNKLSMGVFAGSRPNMSDYGYNFKLFQFGVYANHVDSLGSNTMENSFGVVNQTSDFITDRRFLYLQHISNPLEALSIFASSELELYKVEFGNGKTTLDLSNFYLSTRYAFSREYNVSLSYDVRKNVIYYETYKSQIDSILINEALQGLRLGFNISSIKNISISLRSGIRNMGKDSRSSYDLGTSIYYSNVPYIAGYMNLNVNYNRSNYVQGMNYGLDYSRDISERLYSSIGIRRMDYSFSKGDATLSQNIVSLDLMYNISQQYNLSFNYECVIEENHSFNRFFIDFTTRF